MGVLDKFLKKPSSDYFDKAVEVILKHEGGYVNDPRDPGGETKYGISKRQYPSLNIKRLTKDDAKRIYRNDYWDPCQCSQMPPTVALPLFDAAVNQGVRTACRMMQHAAGVRADGIIGPVSLRVINHTAPEKLLERFMTERVFRYFNTNNFSVYGRGWIRRTLNVMREAPGEKDV